jgi:hypothetical protein
MRHGCVCERWKDFVKFLADIGPYQKGDRFRMVNKFGPYEPGNAGWERNLLTPLEERRQQRRVRNLEQMTRRNHLTKVRFIQAYGGKCNCCDESRVEFLTVDHINGRTGEENDRSYNEMRRLERLGYPKDIAQVLCYNCNCAKSVYGQCPHRWSADETRTPLKK